MPKTLIYIPIACVAGPPDTLIDDTEHSVPLVPDSADLDSDTSLLSQRRFRLEELQLWIDDIAGLTEIKWYLTFGVATWTRFINTVTSTIRIDATDATKGYINYDFSGYDVDLDELNTAIDLIAATAEALRFVHKGDVADDAEAHGFLVLSLER